jgi:hypothetical protein
MREGRRPRLAGRILHLSQWPPSQAHRNLNRDGQEHHDCREHNGVFEATCAPSLHHRPFPSKRQLVGSRVVFIRDDRIDLDQNAALIAPVAQRGALLPALLGIVSVTLPELATIFLRSRRNPAPAIVR